MLSVPASIRNRFVSPPFVASLLLIFLGLLAYRNTLAVPELLDDKTAISHNPSIHTLWPLWIPLHPPDDAGTGGRPVANLSFALNYAFSGTRLGSYHVTNLAIHLAAALTLFGVVRRILLREGGTGPADPAREGAPPATTAAVVAFAASALWLVHPALTIAVTYLSQRTESLMALFYFLTLYAFVRGTAGRNGAGWQALSVLFCFLGMGCKEVMVTAPLAVLLYDRTFVAGSFAAALRTRRLYYAGLAASWILLAGLLGTDLAERHVGFGLDVAWWRYAFTECRAILIYLARSVWPGNLVFDYGPEYLDVAEAAPYVIVLLAVLVATGIALLKSPRGGFLPAWFLLTLAPTSSIVPIALQPIAENRMYLGLAALAVATAVGVSRVAGRRGLLVLGGAVIGLTCISDLRNRMYANPLDLWTDTIAKNPENPRAFDQRGETHRAAGNLPAAIADYRHALELNPDSAASHSLLGEALLAAGDPRLAARHFRQAIELEPEEAGIHNNLGAALRGTGDQAGAIAAFQRAIELEPEFALAHTNVGGLLLAAGRAPEAEEHLRAAVRLGSDDYRARYNLAIALLLRGRAADALPLLAGLRSERANDLEIRNALGVTLMRMNRLEAAAKEFENLLRDAPGNARAQDNLAQIRSRQRRGEGRPEAAGVR